MSRGSKIVLVEMALEMILVEPPALYLYEKVEREPNLEYVIAMAKNAVLKRKAKPANQLRVLLTAAAYVLIQELRLNAAHTSCVRAQVWTLRERLLKLGARVLGSVRRVVVHLPASFLFLPSSSKWRWHPEPRRDSTASDRLEHNYRSYRWKFGEALRPKSSTLPSSDTPVIPSTYRTGRCTLPPTPSPQSRPCGSTA
jgi:hypothetical protein